MRYLLILEGDETAFSIKLKQQFTKNVCNIVLLKTDVSKFYLSIYMQATDLSPDNPIGWILL